MNPTLEESPQTSLERAAAKPPVQRWTEANAKEARLPSPETINYMVSVAGLISRSALIKADMGNEPEQIKANSIAKMLVGWEFGINPMEALQAIDIVKGSIFVRYHQLINLMVARGVKLKWVETTDERAELAVEPPNGIAPFTVTFDIAEAKARQLYKDDSNYRKMPGVMCVARCASKAYRMSGIGGPNAYSHEEKQEILGEDYSDSGDRVFSEAGAKLAEPPNPYIKKPAPVTQTVDERVAQASTTTWNEKQSGPSPDPEAAKNAEIREIIMGAEIEPQPKAPTPAPTTTPAPAKQPAPTSTTAPAPEAPKPAPAKTSGPATVAFTEKLDALLVYFDAKSDLAITKTRDGVFKPFLRAFLGVQRLPSVDADPEFYSLSAEALRAACEHELAPLKSEPANVGTLARTTMLKLRGAFSKHPKPVQDAVVLAAFLRLGPSDPKEAEEHYVNRLKLPEATSADIEAYLRLSWATRTSYKIRDLSLSSKQPVVDLVARIEKALKMPLEQAANEDAVARAVDIVISGLDQPQAGDGQQEGLGF